jgi:regulator of nucleoside diphosphate kinase
MRGNNRIVLSRPDVERLRSILRSRNGSVQDHEYLINLRDELDQARVVAQHEIPRDVVTLQSQVRVRDCATGESNNYTIVSPTHANVRLGQLSVLAPLGTALLGYRMGDEVEWSMPGGVRRLRIESVRQPKHEHHRVHDAMGVGDAHVA